MLGEEDLEQRTEFRSRSLRMSWIYAYFCIFVHMYNGLLNLIYDDLRSFMALASLLSRFGCRFTALGPS